MASGAKRRKAAKKKKEKEKAAISNGNGEVKVMESDSGGNSSPASQELEPSQNPFGAAEDKDLSLENESMERNKSESEDGDIVQISGGAESANGEDSGFDCCSMKVSTNDMLGNYRVDDDDGTQFAEKNVAGLELQMPANEHSNLVAESELSADHVMDTVTPVAQEVESNVVVQEKVIHDPGSIPVEILAGSNTIELQSMNNDEVHPSETFLDFKETSSSSQGSSEEIESNVHIRNSQWRAGSPDVQQSADKEPLLLVQRPVPKTSWTGCCGLFELFTGPT